MKKTVHKCLTSSSSFILLYFTSKEMKISHILPQRKMKGLTVELWHNGVLTPTAPMNSKETG